LDLLWDLWLLDSLLVDFCPFLSFFDYLSACFDNLLLFLAEVTPVGLSRFLDFNPDSLCFDEDLFYDY